jgi:hypothetical protein
MAQPAPAMKLKPSKTVIIKPNGEVDQPIVRIPDGGILEFKSEANDLLEIVLIDPDGGDFYALSIPVQAHGCAYFIGNIQPDQDQCEYVVQAVDGRAAAKNPARVMGNNKIIIGGGGTPETPKRRK